MHYLWVNLKYEMNHVKFLALTSSWHLSHLTECPSGLITGDMTHARNHRDKAIAVNVVAVVLRSFLSGSLCLSPGSASVSWSFSPDSPSGGRYVGGICWVPPILDSVSEINSLQLLAELFVLDWIAWMSSSPLSNLWVNKVYMCEMSARKVAVACFLLFIDI